LALSVQVRSAHSRCPDEITAFLPTAATGTS
jgi:hypothetical protein